MSKPKIIFLLGPTAAGKSELAIRLAKGINAEIISCDSMQIYKKMDIISSKPSLSIRRQLRHHLIDIISAQEEYDASLYRQDALMAVKEILKRGRVPLFVGGTGFYASSVLDGIFRGPGQNKEIREALYKEAERKGSGCLYRRLQRVDPGATKRIHPNDLKRIIRALEVWIYSGRPISEWQKRRRGIARDYNVKMFCLCRARDELYARIDTRVDRMFRKGIVKEVKSLLRDGLSKTASCAIGIKEIKGYLEGKYSLIEAKDLIKRHTRQYAKSQLTWFRRDRRITWVEITDFKSALRLIQDLIDKE